MDDEDDYDSQDDCTRVVIAHGHSRSFDGPYFVF